MSLWSLRMLSSKVNRLPRVRKQESRMRQPDTTSSHDTRKGSVIRILDAATAGCSLRTKVDRMREDNGDDGVALATMTATSIIVGKGKTPCGWRYQKYAPKNEITLTRNSCYCWKPRHNLRKDCFQACCRFLFLFLRSIWASQRGLQ
jgi:hypothetical protein